MELMVYSTSCCRTADLERVGLVNLVMYILPQFEKEQLSKSESLSLSHSEEHTLSPSRERRTRCARRARLLSPTRS